MSTFSNLPKGEAVDAMNRFIENSFAGKIGMVITEMEKGFGRAEMVVDESNFNPTKTLHGGTIFTLADTLATGCCIYSYSKPATTTSSHIQFLKPVKKGKVIAEAKALRMGKKIAVWEVKCFLNGELIANAIIEHLVLNA
jgi:acyl-CoA thioesterase